jgi:excisionase family DNA binding protein
MTPPEAAAALQTTVGHLLRLAKHGAIASVRLGNGPRARIRFNRGTIEKLIGGEVQVEG